MKKREVSATTRRLIGDALRRPIFYSCDNCGTICITKKSAYERKMRHFCCQGCYSEFRTIRQPIEEHPKWQGGVSSTESHRRWKKKNPERMAHLKARRYARERGAAGLHALAEWVALKTKHGNKCAICREEKPLTKDHSIPLSLGGSDSIENIQPLCRNCNSRKWAKLNIYENPELLEKK